ncbi:MAG: methyltransferase domain-containing protein [Actinomycetes bacterium]
MEPNSLPASTAPRLLIGDQVEVDVGAVAHGGHFVARHEGQVIFVRHAITGERALVEITSVSAKIAWGDAIAILTTSEYRVKAPCVYAAPGGCGGCDFQHVEIGFQRELKRRVIVEQFLRVAKLEMDLDVLGVEPADGLHWRTRMDFAISPAGHLGLYASRSNSVVQLNSCEIAVPEIDLAALATRKWSGDARVEVAISSAHEVNVSRGGRSISGPTQLHESVGENSFEISPSAFWQSHKSAPTTLVEAAMDALNPMEGDDVCDLYAGVGLFTAEIARRVGNHGTVHLIESDHKAIADAHKIFKGVKNVQVHSGRVEHKISAVKKADLILLDPPRTGAGEMVITAMVRFKPRTIVYVSCDPASLARDAKLLFDSGYDLDHIVGFDLFPMTHHVECVAQFSPKK